MANPTPSELKKVLLARGFEIYRTGAQEVTLADRVRDNLLMDSMVAARTGDELAVRLVFRAEASSFPGDTDEGLFERARALGRVVAVRGYTETGSRVVPIHDPGDRAKTLDTWYEILMERTVPDLEELVAELRLALAVEKSAAGAV